MVAYNFYWKLLKILCRYFLRTETINFLFYVDFVIYFYARNFSYLCCSILLLSVATAGVKSGLLNLILLKKIPLHANGQSKEKYQNIKSRTNFYEDFSRLQVQNKRCTNVNNVKLTSG